MCVSLPCVPVRVHVSLRPAPAQPPTPSVQTHQRRMTTMMMVHGSRAHTAPAQQQPLPPVLPLPQPQPQPPLLIRLRWRLLLSQSCRPHRGCARVCLLPSCCCCCLELWGQTAGTSSLSPSMTVAVAQQQLAMMTARQVLIGRHAHMWGTCQQVRAAPVPHAWCGSIHTCSLSALIGCTVSHHSTFPCLVIAPLIFLFPALFAVCRNCARRLPGHPPSNPG